MHFSVLIICMVAWNVYVNVYIFEFVYRYVCILNIQVRKSYRNIQVLTGNNEQMYAVLNVLVILRKRIVWCERSNRITINSPNLQGKGFVPVWSFACVFRKCISVNFSRHLYPHINTQMCVYTVHITQDLFIIGTFRECYNTMTVSLITATMHLSSH